MTFKRNVRTFFRNESAKLILSYLVVPMLFSFLPQIPSGGRLAKNRGRARLAYSIFLFLDFERAIKSKTQNAFEISRPMISSSQNYTMAFLFCCLFGSISHHPPDPTRRDLTEKRQTNAGVLERGDQETGRQRVHDDGARLRCQAAREGGVGAVPAHESFHRRGRALRRGKLYSYFHVRIFFSLSLLFL